MRNIHHSAYPFPGFPRDHDEFDASKATLAKNHKTQPISQKPMKQNWQEINWLAQPGQKQNQLGHRTVND
jgi:hypothetical protein